MGNSGLGSKPMIFERMSKYARHVPGAGAAGVVGLALSALAGWQFGVEGLKRILPQFVAMNPATAVGLLLGGLSLGMHAWGKGMEKWARRVGLCVGALGLVKLMSFVGGPDIGIDRILYASHLGDGSAQVNRMAPNTAIFFVLMGAALYGAEAGNAWLRRGARVLALVIAFASLVAAIGYFNGVRSLYKPTEFIPIALHTVAGFLLLCLGILTLSLSRYQGRLDLEKKITAGFAAALFLMAVVGTVSYASIQNLAGLRIGEEASREVREKEIAYSSRVTTLVICAGSLLGFVLVGISGWVIWRELAQRRQLMEELKEARRAAEEANESKSQFLANMSHEIRTPMSAIIGYADLILEPNQNVSDRLDYVNTIRRNGEHLLTIINDVLDISKIEANKFVMVRADCCPCQILSDVASLMRVRAVEKLIRLDVKNEGVVPAKVNTDAARLRQILINLVGNAIKFTDEGWVRLIMRLEEKEGEKGMLRFDIIDTGIGMTQEQVKQLFQPFVQVDGSPTRRFGGTGLGLTISKRMAEMLGGSIEVDSSPGRGSTFTLRVDPGPMAGVQRLKNCREALAGASLNLPRDHEAIRLRARILLVDDGPDNRRLLSVYLREAGATVALAENGRIGCDEALAAEANGEPFDVVLMDMQMPEMDGYGAAARLRAKGYTRPIIALTANAMAEDREKCMKAGCSDYLSKPVRKHDLLIMVAAYAGCLPKETVDEESTDKKGGEGSRPKREVIRSEMTDETLRGYLDIYIKELPTRVRDMEGCLAHNDLQRLSNEVHKLKGTGGLYGLMPITDAAGRVEKLLGQEVEAEAIKREVMELIDILRSVEGYEAGNRAVHQGRST
ncbi:MAG TPA: ATP-binding protein [Phycisphaerae bacterium]|jgi:signal transduction histidine kinase/DNA-binding NarL/FixJ family response regulator